MCLENAFVNFYTDVLSSVNLNTLRTTSLLHLFYQTQTEKSLLF